jgi:putative phosphoesterase
VKLGVISDIHGDPLALELAWSHLQLLGVDRILCAGDLVGYGPYPDRVVAFLIKHAIPSIRGNHDRWALDRPVGHPDEFGGGGVSAATIEHLRTLPRDLVVELGGRVIVVVHGSPFSDMEYIKKRTHDRKTIDGYFSTMKMDLLICGHTHIPMWARSPLGLLLNPGSAVSMPVVRTSHTFAVVDLDTMDVTHHDVESGRVAKVEAWFDER